MIVIMTCNHDTQEIKASAHMLTKDEKWGIEFGNVGTFMTIRKQMKFAPKGYRYEIKIENHTFTGLN